MCAVSGSSCLGSPLCDLRYLLLRSVGGPTAAHEKGTQCTSASGSPGPDISGQVVSSTAFLTVSGAALSRSP